MKKKNKINFILLVWAIFLMISLSLFPFIFVNSNNKVNHNTLMFLLWSMSSSFVSGFGFIPKNSILRILLSAKASVLTAFVCILVFYLF